MLSNPGFQHAISPPNVTVPAITRKLVNTMASDVTLVIFAKVGGVNGLGFLKHDLF